MKYQAKKKRLQVRQSDYENKILPGAPYVGMYHKPGSLSDKGR